LFVLLLRRNHTAHSTARLLDIPAVAGNQVQVRVRDRLTGNLPDIDSQGVTVRMEFVVEQSLALYYERPNRFEFVGPYRKKFDSWRRGMISR
jgi:hypothetical protein